MSLFMLYSRSAENDSPWDRWTLPTVYTITSNEEDEEEVEKENEEVEKEDEEVEVEK